MQIDITSLASTSMFTFAHSAMENGGENAGPKTWKAALEGPRPLLKSPEEIEAFKDWLKDFGAWSEEEIAAWDDNETQALFLQFVAGDVREAGADTLEDIMWGLYEEDQEAGKVSGNIFTHEGKFYFQLSH